MAINHFKFFFSLTVFFPPFFLPAVCLKKKEGGDILWNFLIRAEERENVLA
jgi:hypothetical protein